MKPDTQTKIDKQTIHRLPVSSRIGTTVTSIFGNLILLLFTITCTFPVVWLFYSALKTKNEFYANSVALPKSPNFNNFIMILTESQMSTWILNTIRNTVLSLICITMLGFIIGYFLSRFRFKGRYILYAFFLLGLVIPIHAIMIPMYVLFKNTGLLNQWYTLILPYVSFGLPVTIFLVDSYLQNIPREMEEAATIDGSSFTHTLFKIIFPMCLPVLVTAGIIQFFSSWNEFAFALILISKSSLMTVPVGLTLFKGAYATDYPSMMAAMFIAVLPAILIYFLFSKQIIKGMVTGAVKG